MKLKVCAVVCVSFLVLASQLSAFDGQRKGFILGGGIGGGYLSYHEPFGFSLDKAAIATNFKIGYAPSNTLEIYYTNNMSWFGYYSDSFTIGASCVAITKYLKPEGKGLFVCGGIGIASIFNLDENHSESGFGAFGGLGYDFAKHWYIQADILYTNLGSSWYSWGVRVTLNVLAF